MPHIELDAAVDRAQVADASAGEAAAAVDGDRLDTADPYAGGYCPPYMDGYCP